MAGGFSGRVAFVTAGSRGMVRGMWLDDQNANGEVKNLV